MAKRSKRRSSADEAPWGEPAPSAPAHPLWIAPVSSSQNRADIERHAREWSAICDDVHRTARARDRSPKDEARWLAAAARFRSYAARGGLASLWGAGADPTALQDDPALRDLAFDHLAVDPMWFRSGYMNAMLAHRMKRLDLTEREREVLRALIVNRTILGARREFRAFCRLIPLIVDAEFLDALRSLAHSPEASVRHRARFALLYRPDGPAWNGQGPHWLKRPASRGDWSG